MNSITLTNQALEHIRGVKQKPNNHEKFLRISVSGGGCSGFQYIFELDDKLSAEDIKIVEDGSVVLAVTDQTSLPFLEGAQIEFVKELGASYFKVNNPNAKSGCGCGSSFSI